MYNEFFKYNMILANHHDQNLHIQYVPSLIFIISTMYPINYDMFYFVKDHVKSV
jgi:hypothetical protein